MDIIKKKRGCERKWRIPSHFQQQLRLLQHASSLLWNTNPSSPSLFYNSPLHTHHQQQQLRRNMRASCMHVADYLDIHIVCIYIPFLFSPSVNNFWISEHNYKGPFFISCGSFKHVKSGHIVDAIITTIIHPLLDCTDRSKPDNNTIQETPRTCRVQRE